MRIIDMAKHKFWGDSIHFLNYEKRRVAGHMDPKPAVGDKIKVEMKWDPPGRQFRIFTITSLEDFDDPPDQFFAQVRDTGLIFENKHKKIVVELGSKCPFCSKVFKENFRKMLLHTEKRHVDKIIKTLEEEG